MMNFLMLVYIHYLNLFQIHGTTELITSSKRPVPLTWHFSRRDGLLRLLDENGKKMNRSKYPSLCLILSFLSLSLSVAYLNFVYRHCISNNRKLSREYLLLASSRKDSYDERGKRRYRSGRSGQRNNGTGRRTQQAPVTKNDINNLRRSQVRSYLFSSFYMLLIEDYYFRFPYWIGHTQYWHGQRNISRNSICSNSLSVLFSLFF